MNGWMDLGWQNGWMIQDAWMNEWIWTEWMDWVDELWIPALVDEA